MQRAPALCGGLGKGVSGKSYPRLCNAGRPRLEPGTFRSQAVRLYRLHQACPSFELALVAHKLPLPAMISSGMLAVVVASSLGYLKRN